MLTWNSLILVISLYDKWRFPWRVWYSLYGKYSKVTKKLTARMCPNDLLNMFLPLIDKFWFYLFDREYCTTIVFCSFWYESICNTRDYNCSLFSIQLASVCHKKATEALRGLLQRHSWLILVYSSLIYRLFSERHPVRVFDCKNCTFSFQNTNMLKLHDPGIK